VRECLGFKVCIIAKTGNETSVTKKKGSRIKWSLVGNKEEEKRESMDLWGTGAE